VGKQATDGGTSGPYPRLRSVRIKGYRPFRDFSAELDPLEVIVGANGSGKSALFEFLRFLRDGMESEIPPGVVHSYLGQEVFHLPGPQRFSWDIGVELRQSQRLRYAGELVGPVESPKIASESVSPEQQGPVNPEDAYLHRRPGSELEKAGKSDVVLNDPGSVKLRGVSMAAGRNTLGLQGVGYSDLPNLGGLRDYVRSWKVYSSFDIAREAIRRSVVAEQEPVLREDMANLSSVLLSLKNEHPAAFEELEDCLRTLVPGFRHISVKIRGQGQVMAYWQEGRNGIELSLADLSDGLLRLICWTLISVLPDPPPLICIDEPELGLHPRTMPVLAGLFDKASDRTQIILATHSSYFLTQFDISRIAVMRREKGETEFIKPRDSKALVANLQEFGSEEIEVMHRSGEVERL